MNILSQLNSYVLRPRKKKQRKRASSKLLKIPGKSNRSDKRSYFQLRTLPITRESIMKECDITPCGGRSTPTSCLICSYAHTWFASRSVRTKLFDRSKRTHLKI